MRFKGTVRDEECSGRPTVMTGNLAGQTNKKICEINNLQLQNYHLIF